MGAKISLNMDQIAEALKQLNKKELDELDILLDQEIATSLDKLTEEMKTGEKIDVENASAFKDL